jgi:hypothetical protein
MQVELNTNDTPVTTMVPPTSLAMWGQFLVLLTLLLLAGSFRNQPARQAQEASTSPVTASYFNLDSSTLLAAPAYR